MKPKKYVQSLQKGFKILKTFTIENSTLSLTEICTITNLSPGTAHRYLATLSNLGYVKQAYDTKKYCLTPRVLDLGFVVLLSMDLRKRVLPYMIEAANELNATVQCSILDGTEILFIERIRSKGVVDFNLAAGSRLPIHCTSQGKVFLAFTEKEVQREIIEKINLFPHTPYTIISKKRLIEELDQIKELGYATNNKELNLGLFAVAAPIFREGTVEAALGLSISSNLIDSGNIKEKLIERLLQITKKISIG